MTKPPADIIIPVWNEPEETRSCLVSILDTTDSARLIIINNGSNRETEFMLEEFSEPLGERALYITTERNIGFVPAVNLALSRVDADWAVIIRPSSIVSGAWLQNMITEENRDVGIISPSFSATNSGLPCKQIETCEISFAGLMLSRRMYEQTGAFDEDLDGGVWCLRDFQQRAAASGHLTIMVPSAKIISGNDLQLGSEERRISREKTSADTVHARWNKPRIFAVQMPREAEEAYLKESMNTILSAARLGHRFTIFLHGKQYNMAAKSGLNCLHTGIKLAKLLPLITKHSLHKQIQLLKSSHTELEIVKGVDGIPVPGYDTALPFTTIQDLLKEPHQCKNLSAHNSANNAN